MVDFMHGDIKPRVLMFAPYSFPPVCAESLVTSKLIAAALKAGWKIDVIALGGAKEWYPVDGGDFWSDVEEVTCQLDANLSPKLGLDLSRLSSLNWVRKSVLHGRKLLRSKKYDAIISRATPIYGHLPALILSGTTGIPWVANWSDPLPQSKAPAPYGSGPDTQLGFIQQTYLNMVAKHAHCHTFPCERLKQYYAKYLPQIKNKSCVVPHIALSELKTDIPATTDRFVLCYSGSLTFRPVDVLFQALRKLNDKNNGEILLHFIVSNPNEVSAKANDYGVDSLVDIEASKSYQEVQLDLLSASVLLVIEAQCDEGIFFPSKVMDIVQSGRPILAISPRVGTLSDILSEHGGGIAADNRSIDSVTAALEALYQAWMNGNLQNRYGSDHLMGLFGDEAVLGKLNNAVEIATRMEVHE